PRPLEAFALAPMRCGLRRYRGADASHRDRDSARVDPELQQEWTQAISKNRSALAAHLRAHERQSLQPRTDDCPSAFRKELRQMTRCRFSCRPLFRQPAPATCMLPYPGSRLLACRDFG